jgi:cytochrome P450
MGVDAQGGNADADPLSFVAWSDDIAEFLGHPQPGLALAQRAQRAALAMAGLFQRALARRRSHPLAQENPDLLALLLQAQAQGQVASSEELLAQCVMLLFAGHETTRHLLCNGVHALLGQPGAWQRLRREPALLPQALRELLRFDSPVQYTGRRVASGFQLHGRRFERGELLIPLIGAAHRDPAAYTDPDALRLDRREAPHLAFGQGPHVCIGAALTYMEAEVAFGALLRRFPELQLAPQPSQRLDNPLYRGWRSLKVVAQGASDPRAAPAAARRVHPIEA